MTAPKMPPNVRDALEEMECLVRCICLPAYKDRGMHDPACNCDSAEAVAVIRAALTKGSTDDRT